MKNTKKFLMILSLVLVFAAMFAVMAFAESGKVNLNDNSNDLQWTFDEATKTLTITGTSTDLTMKPGPSWDAIHNYPWANIRGKIQHVVVEAPITSLCSYAFGYLSNCVDIVLPDNKIELVGYMTFAACPALTTVGPKGTPKGVIDARNFTGEAAQAFEGSMQGKEITFLTSAEGRAPFTVYNFGDDSTVLRIMAVAGSPSEIWANSLAAKSGDSFVPNTITVVNYDGTYEVVTTPEETTATPEETTVPEETTAAPEETTATPETTAAPEETTVPEETTTAPESTTAPEEAAQTGDINIVMVVAIALAALASAVALAKKRRFN